MHWKIILFGGISKYLSIFLDIIIRNIWIVIYFPFRQNKKAMEILCRIVQLSYHEYSLISYLSLYFFLNAHAHAYSSKVVSFNTYFYVKKNNTEPTKNNRLKNLLLFIVLFGITLLQSATFVQSAKNIKDAIILVVKQNILT